MNLKKENFPPNRLYITSIYIPDPIQVLQLLNQLRKEFNISHDERVLPLLERFHHGHRLVLQLFEESLKGVDKPNVPTITRTVASGSESGDVSEGSDVFDTVTQLDDETGNAIVYPQLVKLLSKRLLHLDFREGINEMY